jgi:hypothetical protein
VLGGLFFGGVLSAFVDAAVMTPGGRSGRPAANRTTGDRQRHTGVLAFLVPGALGLVGVAALLNGDSSGTATLITTVETMVAISLGVLVGRAISITVSAREGRSGPGAGHFQPAEAMNAFMRLQVAQDLQLPEPPEGPRPASMAKRPAGIRMSSAVRRCKELLRVRLFYPARSNEPRAASSSAATSFRVGKMASGSPDWSSSSTRPRDARTASRRVRVPVRVASSGAEASSPVSRSSTAAMRLASTVQPPST